jgi:hypothetical protein
MTQTISAKTPFPFGPGFNDTLALNWTAFGIGARTIRSVDNVASSPAGPTFAALAPNAGIIAGEHGQDVAIGKAATFRMNGSAAQAGANYEITVNVTFDDGATDQAAFLAPCRAA